MDLQDFERNNRQAFRNFQRFINEYRRAGFTWSNINKIYEKAVEEIDQKECQERTLHDEGLEKEKDMKTFDEIKNLLVAIQNGYEPTDEEILEIKQVWSDVLDALKPIAEFLEKNAVEGLEDN